MWVIIFIVFLVLFSFINYYIGKRTWVFLFNNSRVNKILYWIIFWLIVFLFPVAEIFDGLIPGSSGIFLTILGSYSMIAFFYIFLILILIDLILLLNKVAGFIPTIVRGHKKTPLILSLLVVMVISASLAYGSWNAYNPIITDYSLSIDKENKHFQQLKIAMVSDIHFGAIVDTNRVKKMVDTINNLQPDIILIAGDITNGITQPAEANLLANTLSNLQTTYGVYAVPGNHDRDLQDDNSQLSRSLQEANVVVLKDKYVRIDDSFYVIGRNDAGHNRQQRKDLKDILIGADTSLPLILIDHEPINIEEAQGSGIDLQVSGHTHKGQIFPANLVTDQLYVLDWGLLKKAKYHLIVSSGYGTWGPPLRIGNHPEVVNITINFKTK